MVWRGSWISQLGTTPRNSFLIGIFALLVTYSCLSRAESLEELFATGNAEFKAARPETMKLWDECLFAFASSNMIEGKLLAERFQSSQDQIEPYQNLFVGTALGLLTQDPSEARLDAFRVEQKTEKDRSEAELQALQKKKANLEANITVLQKKIKDDSTTAAVVGLFSQQFANLSQATAQSAAQQLAMSQQEIAMLNQQEFQMKNRLDQLVEKQKQQEILAVKDAEIGRSQTRDKIHQQISDLGTRGHARAAVILANLFLKLRGNDERIAAQAQIATEKLKEESKAAQIVQVALAPVLEKEKAGHLWEASQALQGAIDLIKAKADTENLQRLVMREISLTAQKIKQRIELAKEEISRIFAQAQQDLPSAKEALKRFLEKHPDHPEAGHLPSRLTEVFYEKKISVILDSAAQNADQGSKDFELFLVAHPQYPDADRIRLKIREYQNKQVEAKFALRLAAIEEVIANDPNAARGLIANLMKDRTPEEAAVLNSRISKLQKILLEKECQAIEEESTKADTQRNAFNASLNASTMTNGVATPSWVQSLSANLDPLLRARSLETGIIERLQILLKEPMDSVTKARISGMLEEEKKDLEQMDEVIARQKIARWIDLGFIAVTGVGIGLCILLWWRKKKHSAPRHMSPQLPPLHSFPSAPPYPLGSSFAPEKPSDVPPLDKSTISDGSENFTTIRPSLES
mgnify:CR=1 FL=1